MSPVEPVESLEHADTSIGIIYLVRRHIESRPEWIYEIQISGHLLMSSLHNVSEMKLSTTALELHGGARPLSVLVGGLGLGYTAQAALASPNVARLRVVEKMDFVIDWMKRGLLPLSKEFTGEDRLEIVQGDVYAELLAAPTQTYDLILIDVDHAPDHRLVDGPGRFYTPEGQAAVAKHLAPGGVLAVWSYADNDAFAAVLKKQYPQACREAVEWPDEEDPGNSFRNVLFFAGGAPGADAWSH